MLIPPGKSDICWMLLKRSSEFQNSPHHLLGLSDQTWSQYFVPWSLSFRKDLLIGAWICLLNFCGWTFCICWSLGTFCEECTVLPIGTDMVRSCFSQIVALKSSGPEVRQSDSSADLADTWGAPRYTPQTCIFIGKTMNKL